MAKKKRMSFKELQASMAAEEEETAKTKKGKKGGKSKPKKPEPEPEEDEEEDDEEEEEEEKGATKLVEYTDGRLIEVLCSRGYEVVKTEKDKKAGCVVVRSWKA